MCKFMGTLGAIALASLVGCGEVVQNTDGGVVDDGGTTGADASQGPDAMVDAMVDPCTTNPTLDEAHDCMVAAACRTIERCVGLNADVCKTLDIYLFDNLPARVTARLLPEGVAAGALSYNGLAMGQCIRDLDTLSCDMLFGSDSPFDDCTGFQGQIPDGGTCYLHMECSSGGYCEGWNDDVQCSSGTCRPSKAIGAACVEDFECPNGAHCAGSPSTCRTGDVGQPCGSDVECDGHLWCDMSLCTPKRGVGVPCTEDFQCAEPLECIGDDLPAGNGLCQRSFEVGDPCDSSFGCFAFFSGLYCDQPDDTMPGTCRLAPGAGENCDNAPVCQDFAVCMDTDANGTNECVPRVGVGESCATAPCEENLFCTSEVGEAPAVCSAPRAVGACDRDDQCESGFCLSATGQCEPVATCH